VLTLTGAGGVGKTRLAIQVAAQIAGEFGDGVWYVDLAPITHPGVVPVAVARALGPGLMHWIQGKKSHADGHAIIKVKRCARSSSLGPKKKDQTDYRPHYYVLPKDDPVAALNSSLRIERGLTH
jgi:hypothetical protein